MFPTLVTFSSKTVPLTSLPVGAHALVDGVRGGEAARAQQLQLLGISAGAIVTVLQTAPAVAFFCDHTQLSVEQALADAILVRPMEDPPSARA